MRIFKFWALTALVAGLLLSGIGTGRLMAGGEPGTLTAWRVPTPDPGLDGIAVSPSGEVYFAEGYSDKIGRLDPFTNVITEWPAGDGPRYLVLGDSGELYFTEGSGDRISRLIPSGDFYSSETIPTSGGQPTGIVRTTDGGPKLWFAERLANKVGLLELGGFIFDVVFPTTPAAQPVPPETAALTPSTSVVPPQFTPGNPALPPPIAMAPEANFGPFTEWEIPLGSTGHPRMLDVAPDGSIWISTETGNLLQFNAGSVMFYELPSGSVSLDVAVDPAGSVWFTESWADKIGVLDPSTGNVTEWPLPSGGQPFALTLAPDGSVWFSEREGDRIGHLEPWSNTITEYQLGGNTHPLDIGIDASGDVWFTTERADYIGRLSIGPVLGPPPGGDAIISIGVTQVSDTRVELTVEYNYSGSQGFPVYIGAWPTQGGMQASDFTYIPQRIDAPGAGTATVTIEYHSASCIATDGIEVFMYRAGQASFLTRQFSQSLTWGCGGGGVLPPPPSGLPVVNLDIDRGCGANYNPGDPLTFSYSVSETAVVTLIDFETSGNIKQTVLGTVPAGVTRSGTGVVGGPSGVETLVLVARTLSGVYVSTGCSFGIGGVSPSLVSVTLDRGCGALYYYGETATVTLQSSVPGRANLFNVTRDGRVTQMLANQLIVPGMGLNFNAPIGATTGRSTLVLQVTSTSGQRLTAACSMDVLP